MNDGDHWLIERREHGHRGWWPDTWADDEHDARLRLAKYREQWTDTYEFRAVRIHREVQDW